MKASAFDFIRAESISHVLELLHDHQDDELKLIAGGQSLVPMMAMRLARPSILVDINRLTELKHIDIQKSLVSIGAGVRQRDIEFNTNILIKLPLVKKALYWVGHEQTRNRGTIGGSLCFADPSAELPLSALILNAQMHIANAQDGTRCISADEFFLGPMFTAVGLTDCLQQIDWPIWAGEHIGCEFLEMSIRKGDFALASAAGQIELDSSGLVKRASFGLGGVGGTPLVFPSLANQLIGQRISESVAIEISHQAALLTEPGSDMHASADYRRSVARTLLKRVLLQAHENALGLTSQFKH
jgi:carbon-monoxide dehydrogenase medium subunit/2-furoyl-CoA dehydrogenase FAD binding subunit